MPFCHYAAWKGQEPAAQEKNSSALGPVTSVLALTAVCTQRSCTHADLLIDIKGQGVRDTDTDSPI